MDRERRGNFIYYRLDQSLVQEVVHQVYAFLGVGPETDEPETQESS